MYSITRNNDYLLVKFNGNFDYPLIQTVIHQETSLADYPYVNDIWLIGNNQVNICLNEIYRLVSEFKCLCPRDATRKKTAIVVNEGLTAAIMTLWAEGIRKQVAFSVRMFHTLEEAERWLGTGKAYVA